MDWTDSAYVATENSGQAVGFFCYSVNTADNIGFLKFVIVDKTKRGKGYGKEMLNLSLQFAFQITGAKAVQLNVFSENVLAHQRSNVMKKSDLLKERLTKMYLHIKTSCGADVT